MRYTDNPRRDDMDEKSKWKRKAKSKQAYVVVDEPPPKPDFAPLDHELAKNGERVESSKSTSSGNSFAQGCAVGGIVVIVILLFLCMLVMRACTPVIESFSELLSIMN